MDDNMFSDCMSGADFENRVAEILRELHFKTMVTGKADKGVDIVASCTFEDEEYTFYIQCKYFNTTVGNHPIQEIYAATNYFGGKGKPVVITNNRMTAEARVYAKRLGVEVIADAEWSEIRQVLKAQKVINPNTHRGLLGIMIACIAKDIDYLKSAVAGIEPPPTDREQLIRELLSQFDQAEIYMKEAAELQQKASQFNQKALSLQREAIMRNLEYG